MAVKGLCFPDFFGGEAKSQHRQKIDLNKEDSSGQQTLAADRGGRSELCKTLAIQAGTTLRVISSLVSPLL